MKKSVKVFPEMENILRELAKSYNLIIISSTITLPIRELLESNNMAGLFIEIMGNDVHTSKVEKIKMAFSKYNADASKCVFVTDTLGDIKEASHMKVSAIGVSWGFNSKETLMKGDPFKIVDSPKDLLIAISDYFNHGHKK